MLEKIIALKIDFPMIVISNCNSEENKTKTWKLSKLYNLPNTMA
jgi:hypothetical protein